MHFSKVQAKMFQDSRPYAEICYADAVILGFEH